MENVVLCYGTMKFVIFAVTRVRVRVTQLYPPARAVEL
jgi:hypothetical protein